jgi:hypothetical protein
LPAAERLGPANHARGVGCAGGAKTVNGIKGFTSLKRKGSSRKVSL